MRRAARKDENQLAIEQDLRKLGYSVADTSQLGDGFVDMVVGKHQRNWLFEIKNPKQPPSARKLTPAEKDFHDAWRGQIHTVETTDQILEIVNKCNLMP